MKTIVHVWRSGLAMDQRGSSSVSLFGVGLNWGHVSIEIPDPRNAYVPLHYWSYWPPHTKAEMCSYYYQDDVDSCESNADVSVVIKDLNVDAMLTTWTSEHAKPFHNINHNCCSIAAEVLRVGFRDRHLNSASSILRASARIALHPISSAWTSVNLIWNDIVVWDPDGVERFAMFIKRMAD